MTQTQIIIARNGTTFLHSIYRNGTAVVVGQHITAQRAKEIHEANGDARQVGHGRVDFNGTGAEWERSYFVEEAGDDHQD